MKINNTDTAVLFIDPQNEVLSEKGKAWPLLHESLKENNTIENMERIFKAAKALDFHVFISPHYFFPTDKGWKFNGPLETEEFDSSLFARKGVLNLDGLIGSGADWLERWQDHRRFAASGVGAGNQRPRASASQTSNQQDYSWRNAREYVRRIPSARIDRTGV